MLLAEEDEIAQVILLEPEEEPDIFIITSTGQGKRSDSKEYRRLGSRSVKGYSVMSRDSLKKHQSVIVGACTVQNGDSLLAITKNGQAIRFSSEDVRNTGRATSGVRVVSLRESDQVTRLAKILNDDSEETIEDDSNSENVAN